MAGISEVLPVTAPADDVPGPPQGQWTYADYAAIADDGRRFEIIDGVLYMTPAPNLGHQFAVTRIGTHLTTHVDFGGLGVVLVAPIDVELIPGGNLVQPDVIVILNEHLSILTEARVVGAPDLVVEVSSPSTRRYDLRTKMDAYAKAGVQEYWLADAADKSVELLVLEGSEYRSLGIFRGGTLLPSRVIPDLTVRVEQFFA